MKRNVILHFEVNNGKLTTRIEGDAAGLDCLICVECLKQFERT